MLIELTQGKQALIDDEDYHRLSKHGWSFGGDGYAYATMNYKRVAMHRFIMGLTREDSREIDHINGNRLDNRKANLRICTHGENQCNRKISKNNRYGYKGITLDSRNMKRRWRAVVEHKGVSYKLGYFETAEQAARAYDAKARELFGQFANLNFKED